MDNKGGSLKSEAALVTMRMSVNHQKARHYNFNDEFVIFLKEAKSNLPYFAGRIEDLEFLVAE